MKHLAISSALLFTRWQSLVLFLFIATSLTLLGCESSQQMPMPSERSSRSASASQSSTAPTSNYPKYTRPSQSATGVVIIDPGHGGHDPGTLGLGGKHPPEKLIVLPIAKEVERLLTAQGIKVIMSRSNDNFIELDDRAALADRYQADLLLSIHADAISKSNIRGATVYIARQPCPQSRRLASLMLRSLESNGIMTRSINNADYRVLVKHRRPAVLVECGYLTNRYDAELLECPQHRAKVARALAEGVINYLKSN